MTNAVVFIIEKNNFGRWMPTREIEDVEKYAIDRLVKKQTSDYRVARYRREEVVAE